MDSYSSDPGNNKSDFECKVFPGENRKTIGDFLILREIGRGGMGVVYEAIQRSLSRRVALKVLEAGISDSPQQLQRFRREAESAAMLHHTNIVGVFGIGEENGVHYYAMQYIDGIPLGDAIATMRNRSTTHRPAPSSQAHVRSKSVVDQELVPRVADSDARSDVSVDAPTVLMEIELDADSSQNGTSNQGQMPVSANLTKHSASEKTPHGPSSTGDRSSDLAETTPIPKSSVESVNACFGFFEHNKSTEYFQRIANLATQVADALEYAHQQRVLHRDIKPSNLMIDRKGTVWIMDFGLVKIFEKKDLTKVGEIVGTLRYMAPEQLEGKAGVTTDIYALGVTLFELLTLRPAFDGDEAGTLAQRLRQSDIPRPRSINPAIPRDLETIVLKATAREPFARYRSAGMMADDLRRYCADMPILARRTTSFERLWRWGRRNPALAITSGSIVLLLGVVAAVASIGWLSVNEAFREAEVARQKAESNLDSAIDAFDTVLENVTSREGPRTLPVSGDDASPEQSLSLSSEDDVRLLNSLLAFYRKFASENADNNLLRERTSLAHRRAAAILVRLGRLAEAEEDYGAAVVSLFRVMKNEPDNTSIVIVSASIHNDLGEVQVRRGLVRQTFVSHLEALALLSNLPIALKSLPVVQFEIARARAMLASVDIRSGAEVGHELTKLPGRMSTRLMSVVPDEFSSSGITANAAIKVLREASEQYHALVAGFPMDAEYQFRFAQCQRLRAILAAAVDDRESAMILFDDALQSLEHLRKSHAKEPKYVLELAEALVDDSTIRDGKDALEILDRAEADANRLAKRFPVASDYPLVADIAMAKRAAIEAKLISGVKGEETLRRAIGGVHRLAERFPDQGVIQIPLALMRCQLVELIGNTPIAEDLKRKQLMRSLDILEPGIKQFENYLGAIQSDNSQQLQHDFNSRTRSKLYFALADVLQKLDLTNQADQARKRASEPLHFRQP